MRNWNALWQGLAIVGTFVFAQEARALTTLKTGMVQLTYSGDAVQCVVSNVSGHSLVVSAVRVKNAANATLASLPSTTLPDGQTALLVKSQPGPLRCEADVPDSDSDGVRLRAFRADYTKGSVDGDSAAAPEKAFPRWDTQINDTSRFKVLADFGGEAVLDRETGLVWQQSIDPTDKVSWKGALGHCHTSTFGGRAGWRLPAENELATLVDPTVAAPGPVLPAGHPFSNVPTDPTLFWTATADRTDPTEALTMKFVPSYQIEPAKITGLFIYWCVRGGPDHQS